MNAAEMPAVALKLVAAIKLGILYRVHSSGQARHSTIIRTKTAR